MNNLGILDYNDLNNGDEFIHSDQDDSQIQQQQDLTNEADFYDAYGIKEIHQIFRDKYITYFESVSIIRKVMAFRILVDRRYEYDCTSQLLTILSSFPSDRADWILEIIYTFAGYQQRIDTALYIISSLNQERMKELAMSVADQDILHVIDIASFSDITQKRLLCNILVECSFHDVFIAIGRYDDSIYKQCRLCRLRRIEALEASMTRSTNYSTTKKFIKAPGALKVNEDIQVWTAPDEIKFNFDFVNMNVLWKREIVDLVHICDQCLDDVHSAIATVNRQDPISSTAPEKRNEIYARQRVDELNRADLFMKIGKERILRRIKEWVNVAMKPFRKGINDEEKEYNRKIHEKEEYERKQEIHQSSRLLINQALQSDKKWRRVDAYFNQNLVKAKQRFAMLKYHPGYDSSKPHKFEREFPCSWNWKPFDNDGTPLTAEAVHDLQNELVNITSKKHKAYQNDKIETYKEMILSWKEIAVSKDNVYSSRRHDHAIQERKRQISEYEEILRYIDNRNNEIDHKYDIISHELDEEMNRRHRERLVERQRRQQIKQQDLIKHENDLMIEEDKLSKIYEDDMKQKDRENLENQTMMKEEAEQVTIDRFWGIDKHEEEVICFFNMIRESYIKRVKNANNEIIETRKLSNQKHSKNVALTTKKIIKTSDIYVNEQHIMEEARRMAYQIKHRR